MAVVFLVWTQLDGGNVGSAVLFVVAAAALLAGVAAARAGREGWAFLGTFVTIALAVAGLFVALFPDVMPTTLADGLSLTTTNAAATDYTLKIMTWVAVFFTPIVLMYQGWTYWVFRKRISVHHIPDESVPAQPAQQPERGRMKPLDPRVLPHLAPARVSLGGVVVAQPGSAAACSWSRPSRSPRWSWPCSTAPARTPYAPGPGWRSSRSLRAAVSWLADALAARAATHGRHRAAAARSSPPRCAWDRWPCRGAGSARSRC